MLLDARNSDNVPNKIFSGVTIVGAGTTGLVMAVSLAAAKIPVLLIEAGGHVADTSRNSQTATSIGRPHNGVSLGRAFGLGGTSVLWGGQLAEFELPDLAAGGIRWPLSYEELQLWYEHVYQLLGLPDRFSVESYRKRYGGETEAHDGIERFFTHWLPKPNFAVLFRRKIISDPLIKVILNATVNNIIFDGERAEAIHATTSGGRRILISSEKIVFAGGTIENSRFFLSMQRSSPVPWKRNRHVGAYFQDHLAGKLAEVDVLNEQRFREFFENGFANGLKFQPKLRFAKKLREREITGVCGSFAFNSMIGENVSNIKMLIRALKSGTAFSKLRTLPGDFLAVGQALLPLAVRYIRHHRVLAFFDRSLEFHVQAEQLPISSSRIKLLDSSDQDGLFRVGVDWRVDGGEADVIVRFGRQVDAYLKKRGIAQLRFDQDLAAGDLNILSRLEDTYHQCGGLRMADDPTAGVVDRDCRVWGTSNVFVAGACVFPTSSHANCTLTALALALRLSDRLKSVN